MSENIKNYDPPVTVQVGQIQFIEACHPPLVAGGYTVSMSQVIQESEDAPDRWNSDLYASTLHFAVAAPRFTLNPADIHSVYPPVNQSGRFDNTLPHVVFTRRTLPWERTLDGTAPTLGHAFPPWMALLLMQEDELLIHENGQPTNRKYEVRSLPVVSTEKDSLLFPHPVEGATSKVFVPDVGQHGTEKWKREQGQYEKESCLAVDLPAELFHAIAPRNEDLPYLAHVRQVDTGDKEVLAINDKGWFSVLIGNRLPQPEKDHRVFLISLEGHQERLREDWRPQTNQFVRLVVLGTWGFTCKGSNDFKAHLEALSINALHLPFVSYKDELESPHDIVNGAYARGYTACTHVMRQGEKTVSWYRGPLVPLNYDKPKQIQEPVSCADELLRYDPDTGLFDVTYAAAWQLGRLLALQNHSFALALQRARKALQAEAERQMRQASLRDAWGTLLPEANFTTDSLEKSVMEEFANGTGEQLLAEVLK